MQEGAGGRCIHTQVRLTSVSEHLCRCFAHLLCRVAPEAVQAAMTRNLTVCLLLCSTGSSITVRSTIRRLREQIEV